MNALAGRRIVVTRPAAQAGPLLAALAAAGAEAIAFPVLQILPAADPGPAARELAAVAPADLTVFVSHNAAWHADRLRPLRELPGTLLPIGAATAHTLASLGAQPAAATAEATSEALLARPALAPAAVAGRHVRIVRGNGGKPLLGDTLRQRGARVTYVEVYRRAPVQPAPAALALWEGPVPDAVTATSAGVLDALMQLVTIPAQRRTLLASRLVAVNSAMVKQARDYGFVHPPLLAASAHDRAVLAACRRL
ncbi:MAG: uroporphyrinogen-III synthase [Pseudomonadota bacterium]|nr:uroporphyrinogen-III synthase [Pseudomonadota bacterium]HJO36356.1 uroporphyrinogen-III synthase [Gammaproteobacteria bacterium]